MFDDDDDGDDGDGEDDQRGETPKQEGMDILYV